MASRPILAAMSAKIEADGGDEYIFDQVVAGVPIKKIVAPYGVTRGMFYWWLRDGGEVRQEGYELAKKASAEAHAELAGEVLDELKDVGPSVTPAQIQLGRAQSDYHRYLARVRDREQFGEQTGPAVQFNLSVGDAHLAVLKELGQMGRAKEIPEAEATVALLEGDDDDEFSDGEE